MPYGVTDITVEDFDRWKAAFDASVDRRREAGEKGHQIFRSLDEPNNLVLIVECGDLEKARAYVQSDELGEAMRQSGVVGRPETRFFERVEEITL